MIICCDTSFLFSLYCNDAHSSIAKKYVKQHSKVLSLSPLNGFEFYQALRFAEFSKLLAPGKSKSLIASFEKDVALGFFSEPVSNLAGIMAEAHRLSSLYTLEKGYRAFDLLHVAAAVFLNAEVFLTFDQKQQALAKSEGLQTPMCGV